MLKKIAYSVFMYCIFRINKPYLPIPAGDISLKQAWFFVIFDVLVGLLILQLTNADLITTSLYCFGLLLSTFYSAPPIRFKGSSIATVILVPLVLIFFFQSSQFCSESVLIYKFFLQCEERHYYWNWLSYLFGMVNDSDYLFNFNVSNGV